MSIQTNCELPLCLMDKNEELNNYDFVLFHLFESNKTYREYFLNLRKSNPTRLMILDNSAYEFYIKGESLDLNKYADTIKLLKPDIYILPDVLMDMEKTVQITKAFWSEFALQLPDSKPMAVLQGRTQDQMIECLNIYKDMNINHIAIPFHNDFFWDLGFDIDSTTRKAFDNWHGMRGMSKDTYYAMGRIKFLHDYHKNILDGIKHLHFLGSHDPFEKTIHNMLTIGSSGMTFTMDTGYPVKCGIKGIQLGKERTKPEVIIDEFLDKKLSESTKRCIINNVTIFRDL